MNSATDSSPNEPDDVSPEPAADDERASHDRTKHTAIAPDGGFDPGSASEPGTEATSEATERRTGWRVLGWGGSLTTGAGLVVGDPVGAGVAVGMGALLALAPSGIGSLLAFTFGQLAVVSLIATGSATFLLAELGLCAVLLSTVPLATDRVTSISLGIGAVTLVAAVAGVWLAVAAGIDLLIVAGGLALGGAILLYRVHRYGRTEYGRSN